MHINNTFHDPLLVIASGCNHDAQYISNKVGAAEYAASYVSKPEEVNHDNVMKIVQKKMVQLADE